MSESTSVPPAQPSELRALGWGFASLGVLVGTIAGLSSAELTLTLLSVLIALIGGSIGAFLDKIDPPLRVVAGRALVAFSLATTLALYVAIVVKVNELLVFEETSTGPVVEVAADASAPVVAARRSYMQLMRSESGRELRDYLASEVGTGEMPLGEACQRLLAAAE